MNRLHATKINLSGILILLFCTLLSFQTTAFPWDTFSDGPQDGRGGSSPLSPSQCTPEVLGDNPQNVLECFLKTPSQTPASWHLESVKQKDQVKEYTYNLISQFWPGPNLSKTGQNWHHRLTIYVPDNVQNHQALLYLNSGVNRTAEGKSQPSFSPEDVNNGLIEIAEHHGSVVANLQDIPNQYLTFDDGVARSEDSIVAYTWDQYISDPAKNAYWPVFLPMVKAAQKAMDAIQIEADKQGYPKPYHFVLSGASKRGWAAWLTTIADRRVNGLISIVIDILNTKKILKHIHNSIGKWPVAFQDYVDQGILGKLDTLAADKSMKVIDPLSYRNNPRSEHRFEVPKFIINASSDDFFPPDSLLQYINQLPGQNTVRILPNETHFVDVKTVSHAMDNYYGFFLDHVRIPGITWSRSSDNRHIEVTAHFVPQGNVTLWQAYNPEHRDFRFYPADVQYTGTTITGDCQVDQCTYDLPDITSTEGYTSRFLEFTYNNGEHELVVTSPAFVTPDTYPPQSNTE
jgi:PhoPQ-activated pathogenicity-related protein